MKILVTGAGRSCTNWVAEIVKATNKFTWVGLPEDRSLFNRPHLPHGYATKLTTEHDGFTRENLDEVIDNNRDMRVIWCFKHPVANVMSKIVRGQPASKGGDKSGEILSDDGALDAAIKAVKYSHELYGSCTAHTTPIKLEKLILFPTLMTVMLNCALGVDIEDIHIDSFRNTLNPYQKKRYGTSVDKAQARIYENWETAYDGFFKDKKDWIYTMNAKLEHECSSLGYKL